MPEGERNLRAGAFYQYLVKPGLGRGRYCELVMSRGIERAGGARADAEAALPPYSLAGVAVGVDHLHRENMKRILIRMLADFKDPEFALREIANRNATLVSRYHVQHHLAGGDMEDIGGIGLSGRWRFLRGHRKTERRRKAHRKQMKAFSFFLAEHAHNCIAPETRLGREIFKRS